MSKRINFIALFLAFALLLCEINVTAADAPYRHVSDALSASGKVQDQSLTRSSDAAVTDLGTPELISGRNIGQLFGIRSQSKGRELQRLGVKLLLLCISVFCFLGITIRYCMFRLFLPDDAIASSVILLFIHSKDGKK